MCDFRFRRDVDETCALLGCYTAYSGNSLPKFRGNLSVPSSRFEKSKREIAWISRPLNMGPKVCPETLVRNYRYTLCNKLEERRTHPILYHFFLSVSYTDCSGIESESPAPPLVVIMLGVAKWRKVTISFDRTICLSFRPSARLSARRHVFTPTQRIFVKFETY